MTAIHLRFGKTTYFVARQFRHFFFLNLMREKVRNGANLYTLITLFFHLYFIYTVLNAIKRFSDQKQHLCEGKIKTSLMFPWPVTVLRNKNVKEHFCL